MYCPHCGAGVFEVAEGVRLDMNLAEAGRHCGGAVVVGAFDAGEVVVEKFVDGGPHDHAFGGADGALQAPGFPDGGGALRDHVAPAGIGGGGDEVVEDFSLPVLCQGVNEAGDAGVAGVVVAAPGVDDVVDDVLDDTGLAGRGDNAEGEREEVGGLGAGGVAVGNGVEPLAVEGVLDLFRQAAVVGGLVFLAEVVRDL